MKNFEKYFMAHQYMTKIFHGSHKNSPAPVSYILTVRSLTNTNCFRLLNLVSINSIPDVFLRVASKWSLYSLSIKRLQACYQQFHRKQYPSWIISEYLLKILKVMTFLKIISVYVSWFGLLGNDQKACNWDLHHFFPTWKNTTLQKSGYLEEESVYIEIIFLAY